MAPSIRCFTFPMKIEDITGQRILTSTREPDVDASNTEIFVKNVPIDMKEDELIPFFEQLGPLHTMRIMLNETKTSNRGFIYFTYLSNEHAKKAVSFYNGKEIKQNRPISVELSLNNCRIFIGGIPVNKTKDQVWQELIKQGMQQIVDVIMYRSYSNRAENRGFVFVEFPTHKMAARMRSKFKDFVLWDNKVIVDWSVPQPEIPQEIMNQVKIIYVRNLPVMESREDLKNLLESFVGPDSIEKLYKFKNYSFIHCTSREVAESLIEKLREHFKDTNVDVMFAKPPNRYSMPEFRKYRMSKSSVKSNPPSSISPSTSSEGSSSKVETVNHQSTPIINKRISQKSSFRCSPTPNRPLSFLPLPESYIGSYQLSPIPHFRECLPQNHLFIPSNSLRYQSDMFDVNILRSRQQRYSLEGDHSLYSGIVEDSIIYPSLYEQSTIRNYPVSYTRRTRNDSAWW